MQATILLLGDFGQRKAWWAETVNEDGAHERSLHLLPFSGPTPLPPNDSTFSGTK